MKVFISSLIGAFEPYRAACRSAITTLRHEPLMAEEFGARPQSPQVACLQGVREADIVVLVLGERYGAAQPGSQVSATHEEYREAKGRKPVIAFVQDGIVPEPQQGAFIKEVQGWEGGLFRGAFKTPDDLRDGVIHALHDHALANVTGPVDPKALTEAALALMRDPDRHSSRGPFLQLGVTGGPVQAILRPAELEAPALADALHQAALFGAHRIFDGRRGVEPELDGAALVLMQDNGNRMRLDEQGSIHLQLVLRNPNEERRSHGFPALIEETVLAHIQGGLAYVAEALDHIDATQRLAHLAIAARIDAGDHMVWRTQREQDASPNSGTMGFRREDRPAVVVTKLRAAIRLDQRRLAEDILVPLRRQWKQR
jgi:hypothetical protein